MNFSLTFTIVFDPVGLGSRTSADIDTIIKQELGVSVNSSC